MISFHKVIFWHLFTLSSWDSWCRRLCCWMAIGGGRGTESGPSSPSSSPQLCIPEEEDLERVPLLNPSFLILCEDRRKPEREIERREINNVKLWNSLAAVAHFYTKIDPVEELHCIYNCSTLETARHEKHFQIIHLNTDTTLHLPGYEWQLTNYHIY